MPNRWLEIGRTSMNSIVSQKPYCGFGTFV
jgi:hypothetical protein